MNTDVPDNYPDTKRRYFKRSRILFLLPILLVWLAAEVYDSTWKRSWIYRQTHTLFFVDVTAQLLVDGELLTLTRSIRCIRQPEPWSIEPGTPDEQSVFDTLGGKSASGRTIVVNVTEACGKSWVLSSRPQRAYSLSNKDFETPTVLEPIGGTLRRPDHVLYYTAPSLERGDYGIKLIDVTVAKAPFMIKLFDRTKYDGLGGQGWYIPHSTDTFYRGHVAYEIPDDLWGASELLKEAISNCSRPCAINLVMPLPVRLAFPPGFYPKGTRYPVDFNASRKEFFIETNSPNRLILRNLPSDQGIKKNGEPYLRFSIYEDSIDIVQKKFGDAPNSYAYLHTDIILITSHNKLFFVSRDEVGIPLWR